MTLGMLVLTVPKLRVSYGVLRAIYWIPPAIERPSSLLHSLGRFSATSAWVALLFTLVFSLVVAYGLWKEKLWAGCVETALMSYPGVLLVSFYWRYFAADGVQGLSDFFRFGNGPALLWVLVIISLLWTDRLIRLSDKGNSLRR